MKYLVTAAFVLFMRQMRKPLLAILTVGLLGAGPLGFAEEGEADVVPVLEEIIVTARQREESIQDIPISVSAFTGEDFDKRAMRGLEDVARFTAGLSFEDFGGGFATPVIRGASQTRLTAIEQNVSVFFDGVYVPRGWAINPGVANLSRIEVVKGPQSARYGRNAFMGAINYVPKGPSEELSVDFGGSLGTDERYDFNGSLSGPLAPGLAYGSVSYSSSEFDGSWSNGHPFANANLRPGTSGNGGGWDNQAVSASLRITPSDRLEVNAAWHNFDLSDENRGSSQVLESRGLTNCGSIGAYGNPRLYCGELPAPPDSFGFDPRAYGRQAEIDIIRAGFAYELAESLTLRYLYGSIEGDVDIASISESSHITCSDTVPGFCRYQNTPLGGIDYSSHELRLSSEGAGPLTWTLGAYVSDGQDETDFRIPLLPVLSAAPREPLNQAAAVSISNVGTDTDVQAGFGEIAYAVNDRWRLSMEARYSSEEKTQVNNATGAKFNDSFKNFTIRATAEYSLDEGRLLYASVANGVKAGGFNPTAVLESDRVFDEERNWTYEVGGKAAFADGRLLVNAALFYVQWRDVQLNASDSGAVVPNAVNITLNLGDATMYGLELDLAALLTENFQLDASAYLVDATYDGGTIDARFSRQGPFFFPNPTSCDDVLCPSNGEIGGNDVERQAPVQLSAGAEWRADAPGWNGGYYLRGDLSYQAKQQAESMNLSQIPGRTLLNASAGMNFGNFDVWLWARNLTDKKYSSNAFVVLLPFGNGYSNIFGERRTLGLSARYSF